MKNIIARNMVSCLWTALATALLTVPDTASGQQEACCLFIASGSCSMETPINCHLLGGTLQGPGSACAGADLDGDGIDDGCTCTDPPAGIVAWWPLDEQDAFFGFADLINENNALGTGPDFLAGEFVGNSRCFGGNIFDVLTVGPDDPALNFGTGDLTIDAWVRTSNMDLAFRYIVAKGSPRGYGLFVTSGQLGFRLGDGDGPDTCSVSCPTTTTEPCTEWISAGPNLADGNWHHVAVTLNRDLSNGLVLYVDGNVAGTFDPTCHPDTITNTESLHIGTRGNIANTFFDGCIDEVELFERSLTTAEIRAIRNAGVLGKCKAPSEACCFTDGSCSDELPSDCEGLGGTSQGTGSTCHGDNDGDGIDDACACTIPPADMIAWWRLDETSGTSAEDSVGGNNGTHVNGPTPLAGEFVANALCFLGAGLVFPERVEVPDDPTLNFGIGDFSIDAWIRTFDPVRRQNIVWKQVFSTPLGHELGFFFFLKGGLLAFQMADVQAGNNVCSLGCNATDACTLWVSAGPNVADGRWHHVAVTADRDSPAGLVLYVDGVNVGTFDPTCRQGSITNTAIPLIFASGQSDLCIDEVELFDRALTASEVQAIYFAGPLGKCCLDGSALGEVSKTFCISGTSDGVPYAWRLSGPSFSLEELSAPPVAVGSGAEALAAAFVASLNSVGCPDKARVQETSPNCFTVTILGDTSFQLEAGSEGNPGDCCVTCAASVDGCSYNPTITEIRSSIPAVSDWGLVAMTLSLLCAGTVAVMRRARRPYGKTKH